MLSLIISAQQETDSTRLFYNIASGGDDLFLDSTEYSKKLDGFHQYRPELKYGRFYQRESNIGHALRPLDFSIQDFVKATDQDLLFSDPYYPYLWRKDNIRYYTSLKPITDLYYVMGQNSEQYFKVLHAQPVTKRFYFSVEHKILNSPGTYQHHLSNHESPVLNLRYNSNNQKYHALVTYFHNKVEANDNGGIQHTGYFTDSLNFEERELIPVNLPNSKLLIRGGGFHFRQSFYPSADSTTMRDSLGTGFYHDFFYQKDSYRYTDGGNIFGFYPDSAGIEPVEDTLATKQFINTIGSRFKYKSISFDINLSHKFYSAWQQQNDSTMNMFETSITTKFKKQDWSFKLYGDLGFLKNHQEWKLMGDVKKSFGKIQLLFSGGYVNAMPAYFLNRYQSTYYDWENDFDNTDIGFLSAKAKHQYFNASVSLYEIADYIYFNPVGDPQQHDQSFQLMQIRLNPEFAWKGIHLKNNLIYQKVLGENLLRLPQYMASHQLYYSFNLIQGVLSTQAGVQLTYHTSFKGHKYIPASQAFIIQNDQKLGNYPYLDVFANFYVKRTRIFVKYSHVNALLGNKSYFLMPSYPMRDECFQFGISWMFYD